MADAAVQAPGRRHERDMRDHELRSEFQRTIIAEDRLPVHTNPLLDGAREGVRGWLRARGLEPTPENLARARAAVQDGVEDHWRGAEILRIRKTQRRYDAEVRRRGTARGCDDAASGEWRRRSIN